MDGNIKEVIERKHVLDETIEFEFSSAHRWNGWFFEMSPHLNFPTRFAVYTKIDDEWRQVGSSSFVQIADNTIFLNGNYVPLRDQNHFKLSGPGYFGFWLSRLVGGVFFTGLFVSGVTGRARTGVPLLCSSFLIIFLGLQVVEAFSTFELNGNYSYIACSIIVLFYCTAVIPLGLLQGRWIDTFMLQGACFAGVGMMLYLHVEAGRRSGLLLICSVGAPLLLLSSIVKLSAAYIRRASGRAIAPDECRHAELWAAVLAADGTDAALQHIDDLLSDFAAPAGSAAHRDAWGAPPAARGIAPASRRAARWSVSRGPGACRQALSSRRGPTWPGGALDALLLAWAGREEYPVLADLERLFDQAAAAAPALRRSVFAWARGSGGYLPFLRQGGQALDDGEAGACVVSATGSFKWRRGSAGIVLPLRRVAADDSVEDVAWAGLKRRERSIEKVRSAV